MKSDKALIVVDIQEDFMPSGNLPVPEGDMTIEVANDVMESFDENGDIIVGTQDWHPENHGSFASQYEGKEPMDTVELDGREQILWPDHCIQGGSGASFATGLNTEYFQSIFRKGQNPKIDSYSGFYDNGHAKSTGLDSFLRGEDVKETYILGVATDVCVLYTALDSLRSGFKTYLIKDGCRGVEEPEEAIEKMKEEGVSIIESEDIL